MLEIGAVHPRMPASILVTWAPILNIYGRGIAAVNVPMFYVPNWDTGFIQRTVWNAKRDNLGDDAKGTRADERAEKLQRIYLDLKRDKVDVQVLHPGSTYARAIAYNDMTDSERTVYLPGQSNWITQ
jgi:hypothetical protein